MFFCCINDIGASLESFLDIAGFPNNTNFIIGMYSFFITLSDSYLKNFPQACSLVTSFDLAIKVNSYARRSE